MADHQRRHILARLPKALGASALLALVACTVAVAPSPTPNPVASIAATTTPVASPTARPEPTGLGLPPDVSSVTLGAEDVDRPLGSGSYRIGAPFDAPFTIAFPSEWTLKSLSQHDVSFLNTAVNGGDGAAWITIDRIDTVFDDPCHGGPISPSVPATVDAVVAALTTMRGFSAGPVTDTRIGGATGLAVQLRNSIDTQTADCNQGLMLPLWTIRGGDDAATNGHSIENLWVLDVDQDPLIIDGTMFAVTPEASLSEIVQVVQALRFGDDPAAPIPSLVPAAVSPGLSERRPGGESMQPGR